MKILPRLTKRTMWMVCSGEAKSIIHRPTVVELWESVGLCIHEYDDVVDEKWRISHVQSGRTILRHIINRELAIEYMMRVCEKWRDWDHSEEKIRRIVQIRPDIVVMLKEMQKEISGERR